MTVRIGLWGARADQGGLAAMTHDFFRHVEPDETMVVDLGDAGRGPARVEQYPGARVVRGYNDAITEGMIRQFARKVDVVYAAETFYREDVAAVFADCGVPTVLHVMPELWRQEMAQPTRMWAPTTWELGRLPEHTEVVPVPVDTDRFPARLADVPARRFMHLSAPAFHDRNGSNIVDDALAWIACDEPITVVYCGARKPPPAWHNHHGTTIRVEWDQGGHATREALWAGDADALVMPRRYAGLSLPMQEAAAQGMPIVATDLPPQNAWLPAATLAPARPHRTVRMVGGHFTVYDASPVDVADRISVLANDTETARSARSASLSRAQDLSWDRWKPRYLDLLQEATA